MLKNIIAAKYEISDRTVERYFKAFKSGISVLAHYQTVDPIYPIKFSITEKQLVNGLEYSHRALVKHVKIDFKISAYNFELTTFAPHR
jgi:hypothetical protein